MRPTWRRWLRVAAALLAAGGCVELPDLDDVQIECQDSGDCPSGMVCRESIGRCVEAGNPDQTPPAFLSGPEVSSSHLSRMAGHDTLTVSFTLDEDLGLEPPGLIVKVGGTPLECSVSAGGGQAMYSCSYTVGEEVGEGAQQVEILATDAAGNRAAERLTVYFDFTPPGMSGSAEPMVMPSIAAVGELVLVRVFLTEPVIGAPGEPGSPTLATAGEQVIAFALEENAGGVLTFTHTVAPGSDGDYALRLGSVVDLAGNPMAGAETFGAVTFDGTAPQIIGEIDVEPERLSRVPGHDSLIVSFGLDEDLGTGPPGLDVHLGDSPLPCTMEETDAGNEYTCTYTIGDFDAEGVHLVTVAAEDAAGNRTSDSLSVTFDFTPAGLSDSALPTIVPGEAMLGELMLVRVFLSEPVLGQPGEAGAPALATLGSQVIAFDLDENAGGVLTFIHTVAAGEDGEYSLGLTGLVDEAANPTTAAIELGPVTFDTQPPQITAGPDVLPERLSRVAGHDELTVTFSLDSDVGVAPPGLEVRLDENALPCGVVTDDAGSHYSCSYQVSADDGEGSHEVSVAAQDTAGNRISDRQSVFFDFTPPGLSDAADPTVVPAEATVGELVLVRVYLSEPVLGQPGEAVAPWLTTVGDQAIDFDLEENADGVLTFTHTMAEGEDGSYSLRLGGVTDKAGNQMAVPVDFGALVLDGTAPVISDLVVDRDRYSGVDGFNQVTVTFSLDEDLGLDAPFVRVSLAEAPILCERAGAPPAVEYTCVHEIAEPQAGDPLHGKTATRSVVVQAQDAAGNRSADSTNLILDHEPPAVVAGSERVVLLPGASNPLREVDGVAEGTTVQVSFGMSEPVAEPSVASTTPEVLDFVKLSGSDTWFTFGHPLSGSGHAQGDYSVEVTAADGVGNAGSSSLVLPAPGFSVDTQPPDVPDVTAPDAATPAPIVYRRLPWGSSVTGGEKRFQIVGTDGAVEPGVTVIAYEGADPLTSAELGRVAANAQGAFAPFELKLGTSPVDFRVVYLGAADAAGNLSALVDVKDVEWVATMGGKVPGSLFENPHVYESRAWFANRFAQQDAVEPPDVAAVGAGGAPVETRGAADWRAHAFEGAEPEGRSSQGMVYDSARQRVVLFGGYANTGYNDETWEWDGASWHLITPLDPENDGNPSPRSQFALAFDPLRERTVLFGGYTSEGAQSDELWEWDGASWALLEPQDPEGDGSPEARDGHRIAYAAKNKGVLLFGGFSQYGCHDQFDANCGATWLWNGASWQMLEIKDPEGVTRPKPRSAHAMAYDPGRGRLVLHGGYYFRRTAPPLEYLDDTWEWDGTQWLKVCGAGTACTASFQRSGADLAFEPTGGEMLLTGGSSEVDGCGEPGSHSACFGVFSWNGSEWSAFAYDQPWFSLDGYFRSAGGQTMATDSARQEVLLFGFGPQLGPGETFLFDGADWRHLAPSDPEGDGNPDPRRMARLKLHEARGRPVLFGGSPRQSGGADSCDGNSDGRCLTAWEWDGRSWARACGPGTACEGPDEIPAAPGSPTMFYTHEMAYDPGLEALLVQGGYGARSDCTWALGWDGSDWSWSVPCDPGAGCSGPGSQHHPGMAYDRDRSAMVLFSDSTEPTWEWGVWGTPVCPTESDPCWRDITPPVPVPGVELGQAMIYDEDNHQLLLYGGEPSPAHRSDELWRWDGASWSLVTPTDPEGDGSAPAVAYVELAYDTRRRSGLLWAGEVGGLAPGDAVWEWTGESWAKATIADPFGDGLPASRPFASFAYDSSSNHAVLFGGGASSEYGDTWTLDMGADAAPGQVFRCAFGAAGAAAGAVFLEVKTTWSAGGTGYPDGAETDGVDLLIFDRNTWTAIASTAAPVAAPEAMTWSTTDADQVARMLRGPEQALGFAVTSPVNGTGWARLAVDYVEVKVRYRRP